MSAQLRPIGQLVRRAGPYRVAAKSDISLHQLAGLIHFTTGQRVAYRQVIQRHQPVIGPGWNRQRGVVLEHEVDKVEMRAPAVKAGVDMRETDVDQGIDLIDMSRRDNGFHGKLHGLAKLAGQSILIQLV